MKPRARIAAGASTAEKERNRNCSPREVPHMHGTAPIGPLVGVVVLRQSMPEPQFFAIRQLRERLGVPVVTARRWMRTGKIPTLARLAIMVVLGGDLGKIDPAWRA
jgi:hypothetical protein